MWTQRRIILVLIVSTVALSTLGIGIFIGWLWASRADNQSTPTPTPTVTDTATPTELVSISPTATAAPTGTVSATPTPTAFNGSYVKASLPSGWTIKEFGNGQGTTTIVGGVTYKGLTGMTISYQNTQIVQLQAQDGVGGQELCSTIPVFSDTSKSYQAYLDYTDEAQQTGQPAPQFVNVTGSHSETALFGVRLRRVGSKYFKNLGGPSTQFNPACSDAAGSVKFTITSSPAMWTRSPSGGAGTFSVNIKANTSTGTLAQLDTLLKSLQKR